MNNKIMEIFYQLHFFKGNSTVPKISIYYSIKNLTVIIKTSSEVYLKRNEYWSLELKKCVLQR